jgi:malate/lactate dehydrogenase
VNGLPVEEYAKSKNKTLRKDEIESYMKAISKFVVDNIGGTEYGPAASFRDIVRAIVRNTGEIVSVATPMKFEGIPEPVFVGIPLKLGRSIGPSLYDTLSSEEKKGIWEAAKAIYQTYQTAIEGIE